MSSPNDSSRSLANWPGKTLDALVGSLRYVRHSKLWLQVLIAMVLGVGAGILLSEDIGWVAPSTARPIGAWLALPGQIFLGLIKMIVVPLIFTSIIQGIASATDLDQLKSTGLGVAGYFVLTSAVAVGLGVGVGALVKPGSYINAETLQAETSAPIPSSLKNETSTSNADSDSLLESLPEQVSGVLPENPLGSIVEGEMLQIVIFALIIGIGLLLLKGGSAKPLLDLTSSIQEVSMAIVGLAMSFAPLAVFGLLAQSMMKTGPEALLGLGVYTLSVIGAMFMLYCLYILLATTLGRINPLKFLKATREPALIAFSTNSSAATMPITVQAAEQQLKIRRSLSQFIVPLGATVNMGGTACYHGLTTMFMAQLFGLELSTGAIIALVTTAVGASIGTPAVPGVGMIVLAGVLSSAGIPLTGIPLIIGLDRILERFRTSLNVTGDLSACVIIERFQVKEETLT